MHTHTQLDNHQLSQSSYMYCRWSPSSYSVCAIGTPLEVNRKFLSVRREPMLSVFLTLNAKTLASQWKKAGRLSSCHTSVAEHCMVTQYKCPGFNFQGLPAFWFSSILSHNISLFLMWEKTLTAILTMWSILIGHNWLNGVVRLSHLLQTSPPLSVMRMRL